MRYCISKCNKWYPQWSTVGFTVKIPYSGKVWWGKSLANLANLLWFAKPKPSNFVRRAIGVQHWATYTSVSLMKSPYIDLYQHLWVLKSSFLYIYPFILPLQTFKDKGIMKSVTLLLCPVEYQVTKKPARSVIEHVWSTR